MKTIMCCLIKLRIMNTTKVLYVFVLSTLLVLTGCFGTGIIDEGEGQSTGDTGTNDNTGTTTSSGNSAPYIDARTTGVNLMDGGMASMSLSTPIWETPLDDLEDDEEPVLTGYSLALYHAVMDLDGSVASMGWDIDLDGTIDTTSTGTRGMTTVNVMLSEFVSFSQDYVDMIIALGEADLDDDELEEFENEIGQFMVTTTVAFIATDDGGATSALMVPIDTSAAMMYIWASSLAEGSQDIEEQNQFKAEDHPSATTDGMTDNLLRLSFTHGPEDLEWAFLRITLFDEEDGITYICEPGGYDCSIGEQTSDTVWSGDEVISLAEGGSTDICGAAGSGAEGASCELKVSIQYKGQMIAGTSGIIAVA